MIMFTFNLYLAAISIYNVFETNVHYKNQFYVASSTFLFTSVNTPKIPKFIAMNIINSNVPIKWESLSDYS